MHSCLLQIPDISLVISVGNSLFLENRYELAIEKYTEAISIDPENAILYSNRSACYAALGNWKYALSEGRECIRLDKTFVKGYYRVAIAYISLRNWKDALTAIINALKLEPGNRTLAIMLKKTERKFLRNRKN